MATVNRADLDHDQSKDNNIAGKKKKFTKRRKVNHACLYGRRSHTTCDEGKHCRRCIKREIGHLCHDEQRPPKNKQDMSASPNSAESSHTTPCASVVSCCRQHVASLCERDVATALQRYLVDECPLNTLLYQPETLGNEFSILIPASDFLQTLGDGSYFASPPTVTLSLVHHWRRYMRPPADPSQGMNNDLGPITNAKALLLLSGNPAAEDEPIHKGMAFQIWLRRPSCFSKRIEHLSCILPAKLFWHTRQQRYTNLADWDCINPTTPSVRARKIEAIHCLLLPLSSLPLTTFPAVSPVPIFNWAGDCFSAQDASSLDDPDGKETRIPDYLDNAFCLLWEDMLYELEEELHPILAKNSKKKTREAVPDAGSCFGATSSRYYRTSTRVISLSFLKQDPPGSKFLTHQSLVCLIVDGQLLTLGTILRAEDLLVKKPPAVVIQVCSEASFVKTPLNLNTTKEVKLTQMSTAIFAFESVLKVLQTMKVVPLAEEILNPTTDIQPLLHTPTSIKLDSTQADSLLAGLNQRVALIQGPPGTGKSFIDALLAKALHDFSNRTILTAMRSQAKLPSRDDDFEGISTGQDDNVKPSAAILAGQGWDKAKLSMFKRFESRLSTEHVSNAESHGQHHVAGWASFITPSLRQASVSSPAVHLYAHPTPPSNS
ncbi:hypothetical protein OG21DRAFT_1490605 [Imleria badia]|nr:hypothetical protein OG21DRAFT_1490605 [Imleria badia]